MSDTTTAVVITILGWWCATGIVLWLNHLPRRTYPVTISISSALLLICLATIPLVAQTHKPFATYLGFAQALAIWAWLEMTYLMGVITGPNNRPCPDVISEYRRFALAVQTSLYHELAVIGFGLLVYWLTADGANRTAWWVYLVLWIMRWSAKLNLFLGVSNLNLDWFPEHLRYLGTYIRSRQMNVLFPISMVSGFSTLMMLWVMILQHDSPFLVTAHTLAATLLALGLLEHVLLVVPLNDSRMWSWFAPKKSNLTPRDKKHIVGASAESSINELKDHWGVEAAVPVITINSEPTTRSTESMG